jgi:hypothetical protein
VTGLGNFWNRKGVIFVRPDACTLGPTEGLPALKARGYGWVAYQPAFGECEEERRIAYANHLDLVAWQRVRTPADLSALFAAGRRWQAKALLVNVESPEVRDRTLMELVAMKLSRFGRGMVITDGWADALGYWAATRRWVLTPECFPEEARAYANVEDCVARASSMTTRDSLPTLAAYGTSWKGRLPVRSDYVWPVGKPWVVYPGDSVEDWALWA